jgi:restriction system protein
MAKRRESLVDVLLVVPWWVSAVVACIAYALLGFVIPAHLAGNQFGIGVASISKTCALPAAAFFLLVGFASFIRTLFVKRKFDSVEGIEGVRGLSWRQFESFVGEAFRRRGYSVMENAVDGPDGGIDLLLRKDAAKFYVQCKQWKQAKVGVKPIRELFGVISAGGAAGGFFVASGEYTQEAREFARKSGIELINGAKLAEMIAQARGPQPFMDPTNRKRLEPVLAESAAVPTCPSCGGAMVLRTARRGTKAGSEFWGCSAYPRCRGTRAA